MKHGIVFVGLLALLSGCSKTASTKGEDAPVAEKKTEAPAVAKPVPEQLPEVLARINGEAITKAEFEQAIQALEQRAGRPVPAEQRNQVYRDILDQLVGFKLLAQEAKTRKIDVPEKELAERVEMFKQHFGTPAEFAKALEAQKISMDQFKEQTRGEIVMSKMMEAEIEAKIKVAPADLDAFYAKNPDQFKQPERVRASHILLQVAADADAKK
ncbi:MAG: SurA N-terminal domain-containing protein, partial [Vicinamibacterales bacterium]|nr:SurA N-terminal domain-containing protein [Vicinamibacterales bacterium]